MKRQPVAGQSTFSGEWDTLTARPPLAAWLPPPGPLPTFTPGTVVALDTETRDGGLEAERGPGWVYADGYIAGVSAAWAGGVIYVPIRHPDTECRSIHEVIRWVEHIFRTCRVTLFNAGYDLAWLAAEGCTVWPEKFDDASIMAVMLDENWNSNSLESCCTRAGIEGKDESLLNQAAVAYGIPKKHGSYKHGIWKLPARYVGPYAEQDAAATLELGRRLWSQLVEQGVVEAYQTEIRLIRVIYEMRKRGIRISTDAAEQAQRATIVQRDEHLRRISSTVTMDDMRSPARLAKLFDAENLIYPRTAKTALPSFTAEWLEAQPGVLAAAVRQARQLDDIANKFLGTYILGFAHRGRIHAEVHPLRSDTGGTVSSRLAYSNPPLQQIPARHPILGPLVRSVFLPEEGCHWLASDFSQQEVRLAVHFASVCNRRGAADAVAYYLEKGAEADFHAMTAEMADIPRPRAKIINLGLMYRMGSKKLARSLGLSDDAAEELMGKYHSRVPWVNGLAEYCEARAQARGYIRLIDGARRHFDEWEPVRARDGAPALRQPKASTAWPNQPLRRAFTRSAMNSLVQGSAARQTKIAMVQCYEAGLLPALSMHDELGFSVSGPSKCARVEEIMVNAVQLRVPVRVDPEVGPTWGKAKHHYATYQWN